MTAIVDRYNLNACHNRKIAALLCGRSFAKFLFHFSQWALVSRVSSTGDLPCDPQNQWQLAFAELNNCTSAAWRSNAVSQMDGIRFAIA